MDFTYNWGLGIGDWGLGIGDWAQSPIPNPQSPIPNPHLFLLKLKRNYFFNFINYNKLYYKLETIKNNIKNNTKCQINKKNIFHYFNYFSSSSSSSLSLFLFLSLLNSSIVWESLLL